MPIGEAILQAIRRVFALQKAQSGSTSSTLSGAFETLSSGSTGQRDTTSSMDTRSSRSVDTHIAGEEVARCRLEIEWCCPKIG